MASEGIELVAPCEELWPSFLEMSLAFAAERPGAPRLWEMEPYLESARISEAGQAPPGLVPQTERWIVEDGSVVGYVRVRHALTEELDRFGGHVGYAVHPLWRGRGLATAALRAALGMARSLGIDEVVVTCGDSNVASKRVIEKNGGQLLGTYPLNQQNEMVCRYTIRSE